MAGLLAAGHEVPLVLTQPDRASGRGLRAAAGPVKRLALASGAQVFQPDHLRDAASIERVRSAQPDVLVVAAYGLILPPALLEAGRHGAINIHASLLPRWRGAAPIQRALLAGDAQTGISIMRMDAGLDTGPVLAQRAVPITPDDDFATLHDKLAALGTRLVVEVLEDLHAGRARAVAQAQSGVTYARKVDKREALLDWSRPAVELERAIRAFHPASSTLAGEAVKLWRAHLAAGRGVPGTVLEPDALVVACGEGALAISELQRAGGKRLTADEFLRGRPLSPGARFG